MPWRAANRRRSSEERGPTSATSRGCRAAARAGTRLAGANATNRPASATATPSLRISLSGSWFAGRACRSCFRSLLPQLVRDPCELLRHRPEAARRLRVARPPRRLDALGVTALLHEPAGPEELASDDV